MADSQPLPVGLHRSPAAWATLVGLAAADVVLTLLGLERCFSEQNPTAVWALSTFGPAGLVGLKLVSLVVLGAVTWRLPDRYGVAAFGGFGLTQLVAVGWNTVLVATWASQCP